MKLLIIIYMIFGTVIPNKKDLPQDRQTYTLITKDKKVYEYAYEEEILEYYKTGTFEYNEDLE
jgi:hypothetical protein